ncbi:triphosphoribosyl-dephospho-CoA synthase MdcB [Arcobacter sp. KX21116]|uniref:triphosphoribosyl-dephospho-CoA synthase MdcB n=1 Tax=Arcobacter iocasae TaxID=2906515 RepID=UPI0035D49A27
MSKLNHKISINDKKFTYKIGLFAIRSLYKELSLSHKPGLVSFIDTGSHKDMDAITFMRSIFSLRNYFKKITLAGSNNADFSYLQFLGIEAEKKMLRATNGINTHKGAIFSLGILCAGVGLLYSKKIDFNSQNLSKVIKENWGDIILNYDNPNKNPISNGQKVKEKYGYNGARYEAANGFLTITKLALPVLKNTMITSKKEEASLMQTLFILMKNLSDTNIVHRGGKDGLLFVQKISRDFLNKGGVFQKNWENKVFKIHKQFISKNLSPGGSADLLASSYFVYSLEKENI